MALDFQWLVDQHHAALFRFAMSLTRSEHDARDLVQDTFLTWAAKGAQLLDDSKARSWLFTTLHRRFLQTQRHRSRFPHLELESVETDLPSVEPNYSLQIDATEALRLLSLVEEPYQAAIALFYLEDYSYAEIGAILDVPSGTVKSRIARGVAQLKRIASETAARGAVVREESR